MNCEVFGLDSTDIQAGSLDKSRDDESKDVLSMNCKGSGLGSTNIQARSLDKPRDDESQKAG